MLSSSPYTGLRDIVELQRCIEAPCGLSDIVCEATLASRPRIGLSGIECEAMLVEAPYWALYY